MSALIDRKEVVIMNKILIDEGRLRVLLYASYKLEALENGGINNTVAYEESLKMDLEWWNKEYPEEQYEYWDDMIQTMINTTVEELKMENGRI